MIKRDKMPLTQCSFPENQGAAHIAYTYIVDKYVDNMSVFPQKNGEMNRYAEGLMTFCVSF